MCDLVILAVSSLKIVLPPASAERSIARLGDRLQEIGRLADADFADFIRSRLAVARLQEAAKLEEILAREGERPKYWALDVKARMRNLRQSITLPNSWIPEEVQNLPVDDAVAYLKRVIRKFGEIMTFWPAIVAGTRSLRSRGITPAVGID
jgi:hypothetical protein